jgi:hypothetical protein
MKVTQLRVLAALGLLLAVALLAIPSTARPVFGRAGADAPAGVPHYMVVETEGHNLLVTDNATNKLYFYTVDKDKPIGSPLKLRASLDLSKVGQPEIAITEHAVQK